MHTPAVPESHGYRRQAPKQLVSQPHYATDHSSASSDQSSSVASPYGQCPLIPCMPDLTRGGGGASGVVHQGHPMSELAGLHAALTSEGVQLLRSPTQFQQHKSWQQQQQQQLPNEAVSPLRSGLQQHRQMHSASKPSPVAATAAPMSPAMLSASADLQNMGAQLHTITSKLQRMESRNRAQQHQHQQQPVSGSAVAGGAGGMLQDHGDARSSVDKVFSPGGAGTQGIVQQLRKELRQTTELVTERARRSASPDKAALLAAHKPQAAQPGGAGAAAAAAAATVANSRPSLASQQQQQNQQQQQELLGLAGGKPSAASAAAAQLAQQVAMSQSLQRLLQPQQPRLQQQQQLASKQELAQLGLQQMQDLTEASQMLLPGIAAQRLAVADAQQGLTAINRVLEKYPQLKDPSAVQHIIDANRQLEGTVEGLRRELQAKDTAHRNTLNVLRQSTSTPRDKRCAQLQHENLILQQQLLRKDAQLQQVEQHVRHSISLSSQQLQLQRPDTSNLNTSSGELSPVAPEGQQYDELPPSPPAAARQVNRSLWGPLQQQQQAVGVYQGAAGSSGSSGSSEGSGSAGGGSSRSYTPDSSDDSGSVSAVIGGQPACQDFARQRNQQQQPQHLQQQHVQQQRVAGTASNVTAEFEAQMAAGRQLAQQLDAMRSSNMQPGAAAGGTQSGILSEQPPRSITPTNAVDSLKHQHQQHQQQYAGMRASIEASHRRQLETERRRHDTTQQQYDLLKAQTEKLERQLHAANAQIKELQQQREWDNSSSNNKERRFSGSGIGSSGGGGAVGADRQQQQQRERLLQESAVRELQAQLTQARRQQAELQQQVERLQAEAQEHKALRKQQSALLLQAENVIKADKSRSQETQQLRQRVQELQQQLAGAQEARAAAEGSVQECRRQLAAAEAEKGVLMDRIRQLADRASLAESSSAAHSHRSRSGAGSGSNGGGSGSDDGQQPDTLILLQQQQQQHKLQAELSGACAELNQQVAGLRAQLCEAERHEERLQVANAQLQERLSRLQADVAFRDASGGGGSSSNGGASHNNNNQQLQHLEPPASWQHDKQQMQQQLANLQEQLAAAQAAAAANSSGQAGSIKPSNDQQQQQQQPSDNKQQQQQVESDADAVVQDQVQQLQAELEERTQELEEWQIHADALEKDLEDLKAQVLAAEGLQDQLAATQAQLTAARSQQQQLQQELQQARGKASQLEYELHEVARERNALHSRVDALTAELSASREGAADLRLRLEHFTGPAGPQARVRQLESSLQQVQRMYESAESRAAAAANEVAALTQKLGVAEDRVVALEGHTSVMEEEIARLTQLPDL